MLLRTALGAVLATVPVLAATPASADVAPKIIGGESATTEEHPWMVTVINERQSQDRPWRAGCGGALVTPNKVVTAAHCLDEDPMENFTVAAGRTDLRTDHGMERKVARTWLHPDYQPPSPPEPGKPTVQTPDVAVITLDRPLPHRTIPLAAERDLALHEPGTPAMTLGWGSTTEPPAPAEPSPTLRKADVEVTADEPCIDAHEQDEHYSQTFAPEHYVCTRDLRDGATTGGGDSGGPLVAHGKLIGVTVSGTLGLEQDYASFTELTTFSDDLREQLK